MGVGYRGYGKSTGRPSEKGVYLDGAASFRYVMEVLGFAKDSIFLMGRSLGTAVALRTAINQSIGGLILVTPLTNGREYAKAHNLSVLSLLAGGSFLRYCSEIVCKTLIIHGTSDEVIPFHMGKTVFECIHSEKVFIPIDGGFHNNLEFRDPQRYWGAMYRFISN